MENSNPESGSPVDKKLIFGNIFSPKIQKISNLKIGKKPTKNNSKRLFERMETSNGFFFFKTPKIFY